MYVHCLAFTPSEPPRAVDCSEPHDTCHTESQPPQQPRPTLAAAASIGSQGFLRELVLSHRDAEEIVRDAGTEEEGSGQRGERRGHDGRDLGEEVGRDVREVRGGGVVENVQDATATSRQ